MSTTTPDPQTWVFPPPGAATPPVDATGNFGPVYLGDTLLLEWTPATRPDIYQTCISKFGDLESTTVAKLANPPLPYTILDAAPQVNSSDRVFCHVVFLGTQMGNSVTFELINKVGSKAVTYSRAGAAAPSSSSSSSSSGSSAASTSSSSSSRTQSQSQSQTQSGTAAAAAAESSAGRSSGLSTGAKAGIGVGVALGVALLAAVLFLFLFRRRKQRRQREHTQHPFSDEKVASGNASSPHDGSIAGGSSAFTGDAMSPHSAGAYDGPGHHQQGGLAELDHRNVRHELPGS